MNENINSSVARDSTSKPPKQGQYRPSAAPKAPRINANDVLQLLHGDLKKAIERTEAAADRAEAAAGRTEKAALDVKRYVGSLPPEVKTTHVFAPQDKKVIDQMRQTIDNMPGAIAQSAKDAKDGLIDYARGHAESAARGIEFTVKKLDARLGWMTKVLVISVAVAALEAAALLYIWLH